MNAPSLNRRDFTAGLGAIVVAFSLTPELTQAQGFRRLPGSLNTNRLLHSWLRIEGDGSATLYVGKVELGQGILTALAQIAAEELDLSFERVAVVSGDTGKTPDEGHTSGSQSVENSGTAVRLACADARAILLSIAAKQWSVTPDTLKTADGVVTAADGRTLGYGELARVGKFSDDVSHDVKPKPPSQHRIVGRSVPRRDIPRKVTGGAAYVQDLRPSGMLHGRIVRPPRYGARLAGLDEAGVKAMPGVIAVVRNGSFLGVIAQREEQAIKARTALLQAAKWEGGTPLPDPAKLSEYLMALPAQEIVAGETKAMALASAPRIIEAVYSKPYTAHASIGPSCALAEFKDGALTVWSHTQGVFPLRRDLAKAMQLAPAKIRCIHVEGAGCYGHNGADDAALDAALLARAVPGQPVRVQWMRDDEHAWAPFGPAMVMRAKAALGDDGRVLDWNYDVWSNTHSMRPGDREGTNLLASWYLAEPQQPSAPRAIPQPSGGGDRNAVPLYAFPSRRIVQHFLKDMPVRVSALRTLGAYANVFALESFMDELAAAAGADPVAFRLAHLNDPRAKAVIEAAAKAAGWSPGVAPADNRGRGIGFAKYKNLACYVACVAEVEVDRSTGVVSVPRVFAAADAGQIINPDGLKNQIEGGIIQSTSWTLHEAVRFDQNGITSRDWASYPILTMPEAPKVTVELLDHPNERSLGAGEGAQGPAVAAIANAFARATGKRMRDLPFTPDRVKAAIG